MYNTHINGTLSELIAQEFFINKGYIVSEPISHFSEYDLIIDIEGKLQRVQVRTIYHYNENERIRYKLNLETAQRKANSNLRKRYSKDSFDIMCGVEPTTRSIYIIPVNDLLNKGAMFFNPLGPGVNEKYKANL